ncbi:hypothetical protein APM_3477 [Acidiphilium sp. PM]|nr:hypothetical protein APM_3477 [Acidiphilium sp. PM]
MAEAIARFIVGSSPRLRGTPTARVQQSGRIRFIPAPAGNTQAGAGTRRASSVHPRACGEHFLHAQAKKPQPGSSPRLRGTPPEAWLREYQSRFIPAPAGNTCVSRHHDRTDAVHPRACGEHMQALAYAINASGSSPRLRGTPSAPGRPAPADRFIPAPAGNTRGADECSNIEPVHPRACGEHTQ